jgi:O-antigen/teichoic acid export membrane protein
LFSVAQGISGVLMMVYMFGLARVLGSSGYAAFQTLMSIHGLVMLVGGALNLAALHAVSTTVGEQANALGPWLRVALRFGVGAGAVVSVTALWSASVLGVTTGQVVALGAVIAATPLLATYYGGVQGAKLYERYARLKIVESMLIAGAGIGLALQFGVMGAVLGFAVGHGGLVLYQRRGQGQEVSRSALWPVIRQGAAPLGAFAITAWIINVPMLIAAVRLSGEQLDAYTGLFALRNLIVPFAFSIALPLYAHTGARATDRGILRRAAVYAALLGVGGILAGLLAAESIVVALLGDAYRCSADYMAHYMVFMMLHGVAMVVLFAASAQGRLSRAALILGGVGIGVTAAWPDLDVLSLINGQRGTWSAVIVAQVWSMRHRRLDAGR